MKKNWAVFGKMLRPFLWPCVALVGLAVTQSLIQVVFSLVTKYVVDAAVNQDGRLLFWGSVLAAVVALMLLVYTLQSWLSGSTADKCMARMRHTLLSAAAYSEEERLQAYHSGEILSRGMEDVNTVCDGLFNSLPSIMGQVTRLVGSFLAVMLICPPLGPVLIGAGAAVAVISALLRPMIKRRQSQVRQTEDQVMATMQEDLQQLELIKSLQAEKRVLRRFQEKLHIGLIAKNRRRRWSVASGAVIGGISQIGTGALLLWGAGQIAAERLSYGALTAMLQLLSLFRGPVVGLSGQVTKLAGMEVAASRLAELLVTQEDAQQTILSDVQVEAVVFEDVTFRYPSDEAPVVSHFSICFPLARWSCLTGISGKGKTTLFKLMLGLYTPQEGRVYLKTNQGEIPCGKDTRHLFAYVPQDFALFSGTVQENLQLVAPDAEETARRRALETAKAEFVWELTHQEQTQVRENNAGLSKGQLQRLAIARAVLMERPIFLLDECTSALDAQTEAGVLRNLQALGKQAILVTHRPEAVAELEKVMFVSMERD